MFSKYFGQYLLNKGILTPDQLAAASHLEHSVRVKLGVLAINNGQMSAAQVEEVHELQRSRDCKFGEIAIEKGYMTQMQLDDLLESQKRRQISLSQAIIDKGFMTLTQLERALASYKEDSKLTTEQFDALQSSDTDSIVKIFVDFSEYGAVGNIHANYVSLLVRNIVRLLNDSAILSRKLPLENKIDGWLISQNIVGSGTMFTGLVMDDHVLLEAARRFSEEDLTTIDILTKDSMAEFLNVHNGIFIVNMSDKGTELDLTPQTVQKNVNLNLLNGCRIPITLSFGTMDLLLAWN